MMLKDYIPIYDFGCTNSDCATILGHICVYVHKQKQIDFITFSYAEMQKLLIHF